MINLIMPMGGRGSRFTGHDLPKPMIEIWGKPFFYWATQAIYRYANLQSLTFVVLQEHIHHFQIDSCILTYFPEALIISLDHVLDGAVLTCEQGINSVDNDYPVVFQDCDQIFYSRSYYDYLNAACTDFDGTLLTFHAVSPCYSFAEVENGLVKRTAEKAAISDRAISGAYYFKNKGIFKKYLSQYLRECQYQEYFVSGIYNTMLKNGCQINAFHTDFHLPFGVPDEYNNAKRSDLYKIFV